MKRFKLLDTLDERLPFWQSELPVNYIRYWELGTKDNDLFNGLKKFDFEIEEADQAKFAHGLLTTW